MMVPDDFASAVSFEVRDLGRGGAVVRATHPSLPGVPVLGLLDPGYPESVLQEKQAACIVALHNEFTAISWDIL